MAGKIRRSYKGAAVSALLDSSGVSSSTQTSISLTTSPSTWPTGKFFIVVAPGTAQEEKMCVTLSGSVLTVVDPSVTSTSSSANGRGIDNTTARSAISGGATVYPVFTALDADEANELTSTYSAQGHMVYQGGSTFAGLAIGTAGQALKVNSGATAPEWGQIAAAGIADSAITSAKIADGAIVNADINDSAAIALSKLATGALPTDITVASANIVNGTIVDADINNSASIALSKLATGSLPTSITVASANIVDGTITKDDLATALQNLLVPVGTITMYGGTTAPTGWLLCDGTSTTGYTQLAALVGSTTPDMRGRFALGDNSTLTLLGTGGSTSISTSNLPSHTHGAGTLATTTNGEHTHSNSEYNMDSHLHYLNGRQASSTSHTHTGDSTVAAGTTGAGGTNVTLTSAGPTDGLGITIANGGSHSHSITGSTGSTGDGSAYYQPYLVVNYIIKHD